MANLSDLTGKSASSQAPRAASASRSQHRLPEHGANVVVVTQKQDA